MASNGTTNAQGYHESGHSFSELMDELLITTNGSNDVDLTDALGDDIESNLKLVTIVTTVGLERRIDFDHAQNATQVKHCLFIIRKVTQLTPKVMLRPHVTNGTTMCFHVLSRILNLLKASYAISILQEISESAVGIVNSVSSLPLAGKVYSQCLTLFEKVVTSLEGHISLNVITIASDQTGSLMLLETASNLSINFTKEPRVGQISYENPSQALMLYIGTLCVISSCVADDPEVSLVRLRDAHDLFWVISKLELLCTTIWQEVVPLELRGEVAECQLLTCSHLLRLDTFRRNTRFLRVFVKALLYFHNHSEDCGMCIMTCFNTIIDTLREYSYLRQTDLLEALSLVCRNANCGRKLGNTVDRVREILVLDEVTTDDEQEVFANGNQAQIRQRFQHQVDVIESPTQYTSILDHINTIMDVKPPGGANADETISTFLLETFMQKEELWRLHFMGVLIRWPCGSAGTLHSRASECTVCDTLNGCTMVDARRTANSDLYRTTKALFTVLESKASAKLEVAILVCIYRNLKHCRMSEITQLGESSCFDAALSLFRSHQDNTRLLGARIFACFALSTSLKIRVVEALRSLNKIHVTLLPPVITAWSVIAQSVRRELLSNALTNLIAFVGHSNPIVRSITANEMGLVALAHSESPLSFFAPYWRTLGVVLMNTASFKPHTVRMFCDILGIKLEVFLDRTKMFVVPQLLVSRQFKALEMIANVRGISMNVLVVENMASILAAFFVADGIDAPVTTMETLRLVSVKFNKHDFEILVRGQSIELFSELLKMYHGENEESQKIVCMVWYLLIIRSSKRCVQLHGSVQGVVLLHLTPITFL